MRAHIFGSRVSADSLGPLLNNLLFDNSKFVLRACLWYCVCCVVAGRCCGWRLSLYAVVNVIVVVPVCCGYFVGPRGLSVRRMRFVVLDQMAGIAGPE